MFIDIQDAPEKARRIFNRLVETFEEQNINPSPLNYYVWYEYYKGDKPQFRQEMDSLLNDEYGYTDRAGKRLYDEYLIEDDSATSEFDRAFRRLIDVVVRKMNLWSDKLENHTAELDKCTTQLANPNLSASQVQEITNAVLVAAQSMKENSLAFQEEMLQSSDEVKVLRQQLMDARSEAMQDELTEIGNRKAFNNAIEELMLDAPNNSGHLCLILGDIDHFKKFNDTYGHLVGDSILRYFANLMKKEQGNNETICRYGGEEFAILLSDTSLQEAEERANNIRIALEKSHLKRKDQNEPISTVTASFGIAAFTGSESTDELISRADKALYHAKNSGRNQVVLETALENE